MDTKQEIKKNEDLIKSLESKRTDIFTFMAKEIKGNPRLEKAVEDLATVNGALEKAYTAKGELEKAAAQEQADLEKAQKEQEEKEALEKAQKEQEEKEALEKANLEKAKDELKNEISESMRAEKEFTDEYVQELANKYSMSVDDIEDAIAAAIEANGGADA
jgi:flagellar biosynthesis GTPase FlhF